MKKLTFLMGVCVIMFTNIHAQTDWHITGNSGTNPASNFIGTTDNAALAFKVNNQLSGYIDFSSALANTSFGFQALKNKTGNNNAAFGYKAALLNSTGIYNTALGAYALTFNTTGYSNVAVGAGALYKSNNRSNLVAIGDSALYNNSVGVASSLDAISNTAVGSKALYSNGTGSDNTALGFQSLYLNTSGIHNTASGNAALFANTTGNYNSAFGSYALVNNQTGTNNTAVGYSTLYHNNASFVTAMGYGAMYSNTTGSFNASAGCFSMYNNTTGFSNAAYGYSALYGNTTGYYNTAAGTLALFSNNGGISNTAHGYRSLYANSTGNYNTALGVEALYNNTTGSLNTAVGVDALYNNTTSNYNCAVGYLAMASANPGYNNTAVGSFTGPATDFDGLFNTIAVGNSTFVTASNQARFGNSSTTSIGGYANWTNISDGRVKKNIKENVPGLVFINKLKPVTYNLNLDAADKIMQVSQPKDKDGKTIQMNADEQQARKAKEQIVYTGFIAQDVEKAAKELNYDFSGVDAAKNNRDLYGLRYAEFVVPLVKAVQELSDENDKLKNENDETKTEIRNLKSEIDELKKAIGSQVSGIGNQSTVNGQQSAASSTLSFKGWALEQNIPNPFNSSTTINCFVPVNNGNTYINIYDQAGALMKSIKLSNTGKNTITLKANELAAGAYRYALVSDGIITDSKTMIVQR